MVSASFIVRLLPKTDPLSSKSTLEEKELLQAPSSRKIIQKVADDTSTLRATMSTTASQGGAPTIVSHNDSTIDSKIFDWDNEIVNADMYRRAMRHAMSKSEMAAKPAAEREERLDTVSQAGTEESSDRLTPRESPIVSQRQKPLPYEMSVASEPLFGQQPLIVLPNSSVSDRPDSRRSLLAYRQKTPDTEKKSFWSAISGKRSSRNLIPPERNASSQSVRTKNATSNSRRGRRGFENSYHTSIDFGSEEGLSAPPIVRAAQAGSIIEVEALLDQRADINARHIQSGRSALSVAAHCGNEEVVRLLLQYGATVDERDASLLAPLHLASLRGHLNVIEVLLQEQADVDIKGPNDQTPLRIASEKGEIEVAAALLRRGAKANARDAKQMTPLHIAAKQGDEPMTELLVGHGAHVEAKDGDFMGPLHYACEGGHTGVVGILLNKKADLEAPGRASMTPLLCASSSGQFNVVELLLKKRASLKHKGEGEMTALHWASFNGRVEVVDLLLQKRAPIAASNKDGRTPLHLAIMADEFAVTDLLLRKGAPVEALCKSKLKPIHYACQRASLDIAQLLLGHNANIEAEDNSSNRPLHNACTRGSQHHVELLVQKGVKIDARNANGDRPLCLASSIGHVEIVKILLNRGAALRSKFSAGPSHEDSPLCLASKNGHTSVVAELLDQGASVLQKDERGWQPLRHAAFNAHPDVVELLLRHGATLSGSASGGWGFNITAQRIGFANDVINEEQRKGQVLRLLTSAEAREQSEREKAAPAASSFVPPAIQNQMAPLELPGPNSASSPPVQVIRSPPPSSPPGATPEMNADSVNSPKNTPDVSTSLSDNLATAPALPTQQLRQDYYPSNYAASPPFGGDINPNASAQVFPTFIPSSQGYFLQGYPNQMPTPIPPSIAPQPPGPTPYAFVPKATPQTVSQYSQIAGMPNYMAPTSPQTAPTMVLRPDGLWQQIQTPGIQQAPSGRENQTSPAPMNYPTGVYEMSG